MENAKDPNAIMCLFVKCGNLEKLSVSEIKGHLYFNGIDKSYKRWIWHGENVQSTKFAPKKKCGEDYRLEFNDDLFDMIDDAQYEANLDP